MNYESAKEFPYEGQESKAVKLDKREEAMKLSKDKKKPKATREKRGCVADHPQRRNAPEPGLHPDWITPEPDTAKPRYSYGRTTAELWKKSRFPAFNPAGNMR